MMIWLKSKLKLSQQFADRDYIVYQDERFKYGQSHDKVDAIVRLLVSLGVRKGTRVGIAMRNLPEFVLLFWVSNLADQCARFDRLISNCVGYSNDWRCLDVDQFVSSCRPLTRMHHFRKLSSGVLGCGASSSTLSCDSQAEGIWM